MREGSGKGVLLAATLFLTVTLRTVYGQDSPLKVEIKTTQASVKNGQEFDVSTKIKNVGKEEHVLHLSQCSYSSLQWMADHPSVHVKQIFCKKNRLIDVRLKPGAEYERPLPVHIEIPVSELPRLVTFRLGFRPRDERISDGTRANPPPSTADPTIWSSAITVSVTE